MVIQQSINGKCFNKCWITTWILYSKGITESSQLEIWLIMEVSIEVIVGLELGSMYIHRCLPDPREGHFCTKISSLLIAIVSHHDTNCFSSGKTLDSRILGGDICLRLYSKVSIKCPVLLNNLVRIFSKSLY